MRHVVKLHLASKDAQIKQLCREVMGELIGNGWTLHVSQESLPECDADLYVWDTENGLETFSSIRPEDKWRHFFVVDRAHVQRFRGDSASADANILLKPVTKATLAAFFYDACARCADPATPPIDGGVIRSLRADRDEILQCLIQTNLKLQEYDQDRTNFLARAIHDFRAPLTAITGYCGLLLGENIGDLNGQQREILERMHRSARKLSRMASAMFQLSIAPRVEVALEVENGELRDCIHRALNEILPTAEEKRISMEVDVAPPGAPLLFEPARIEQVLVNLLDNACKFTPRSGSIRIKGYPHFWDRRAGRTCLGSTTDRRAFNDQPANCYRVDVYDSGPGIPASHLDRIFEEYTSYGGGSDRSGGGLGLAICCMIVRQHKGRIWAESTPDGALFSFVLPFDDQQKLVIEQTTAKAKAAF